MTDVLLLSDSPSRPPEDSEAGWIGFHPTSGSLQCPCCVGDGDLSFRQEADTEKFTMRASATRIGQPNDGLRPIGAIYCYECCRDWEVPPDMCLILLARRAAGARRARRDGISVRRGRLEFRRD